MAGPLATQAPWDDVAAGYDKYVVDMFTGFAEEAIERLKLQPGAHLLDVACGPGTVSLVLARKGFTADAIDFSHNMLERCRARIKAQNATGIRVRHMDGQRLEFGADTFDAATSMFGLMFFPQRARGFAELYRVLKPGGRVAVSSWAPMEDSPLLQIGFGALHAMLPEHPKSDSTIDSLESPEVFTRELQEAGFTEVDLKRSQMSLTVTNIEEFWGGMVESSAPVLMMKKQLGEQAWNAAVPKAYAFLGENLPNLPVTLTSDAWIGVARKPEEES